MCDTKPGKPIRVLHVLHILDRGGAEAIVMNLYRKIDHRRVQFDFLVHSSKRGLFEDEIEAIGGKIYRISAFKGYNLLSYYRECLAFFKAHPEIKIVHGHLGSCAAYYLHAAKKCGKFTIAHSHSAGGVRNLYDLSYKLFSYPTRWVADRLLGCSTEAGVERYGRHAVNSDRYNNFNNAVDTSLFRYDSISRVNIRKELGIDEDTLIFGTVGRVTPQKNPIRVYKIFKEIIRFRPEAICIWVGTGEMEGEIKRLISNENMDKRIIMIGVRSDIPSIMSALDCMVFPSLWEGLPVSVIESQMANLPCLLSTNISRETQISELLSWHSLNDNDSVWASDAITMALRHRGARDQYSFSPENSGYDINVTVKSLMNFYETNS